MSEEPGPDRSAVLWYGAGRRRAAKPAETQDRALPGADEAGEIAVELWLFGPLSTLTGERPVALTLRRGATVEDVFAALEKRLGAARLERLRDGPHGLSPACRVFVNGSPVEDTATAIAAEGNSAKVEMILIKAFEGG